MTELNKIFISIRKFYSIRVIKRNYFCLQCNFAIIYIAPKLRKLDASIIINDLCLFYVIG